MIRPQISWVESKSHTETHNCDAAEFVIHTIKNGKERSAIEDVRSGKRNKSTLPAVMWSGLFSARANDKLVKHSGLCVADLDNLNGDLITVRRRLEGSKSAYTVFASPGANGLKSVFRITADASRHADSFRAIEKHIFELTGKQIDKSGKDLARLCFVSYDPDVYYNPDAIELEPLPEPEKPKAQQSNGQASLSERQRIVEAVVGAVDWIDELHGFCDCPGKDRHTNANGAKDCKVFLDGATGLHCVHNSCKGIVEAINHSIRSHVGKAQYRPPNAREEHAWQRLSTVEMLPIRFVDKPLFQAAAFHLLVGKKGVGKGTFLAHLAARYTRGELGDKRSVLWIAAGEDSFSIDVLPRIIAAGGDPERIYYPHNFVPKLPTEVGLIQKQAEEIGDVGLIIGDPLSGMMQGKTNSNMDSDVRSAISPLNHMADTLSCEIVGVRHLKKDADAGALASVLGSIDWVNVPRAVLAVVTDDDDMRYVQVVAGNRVPGGTESRGFKIVGVNNIVPGGEPVTKAVFVDGAGKDVDEILQQVAPAVSRSKTQQAMVIMLDILEEHGEMKQDDLFKLAAEKVGLSPKTVRQHAYFGPNGLAKTGLVKKRKEGMAGGWFCSRGDEPRPENLAKQEESQP
jgi:hypothetical protein